MGSMPGKKGLSGEQMEEEVAVTQGIYSFWKVCACVNVGKVLTVSSSAAQSQELTEYAYVNVLTRGDLSSLRWIASPLRHFHTTNPSVQLCKVYYASLNFRDIMLATGKLSPDAIPGELKLH